VSRYDWPVGLVAGGAERSAVTTPVEVTTTLELRVGEPFVRVRIAFTNPSRDHRVRWHLPLPAPTDRSAAEGQFGVVDRGLTVEAGHGEVPVATMPAASFVHAAGATILLDHVTEYELVDGRELALTVLRSTGLISRNDNPFREDPAGPEVPVPDAQLVGPWTFTFAVMPHQGSWADAGVLAAAEAYRLPFRTTAGKAAAGAGLDAAPVPGLTVEGDGVVLSALRRRGDELELRLVALRATPVEGRVSGRPFAGAREVDLLGRPGAPLPVATDGSVAIALGPWEIRTIRVSARASTD
jgi:alpha-mannosidase